MINIKTEINNVIMDKVNNFIPLTDDTLFKETFGKKENIRYIEDFLESYFNYRKGSLRNKLTIYYESELKKDVYHEKARRCDLIIKVGKNLILNIEMYQEFNIKSYLKSEQYVMKINSTQLRRGEDYSNLTKVTQINFVSHVSKEVKMQIKNEIRQTYMMNPMSNTSMDIIRLDLTREIEYNLSDRFMKHLKFIVAETQEERDKIAKGDRIFMDINAWLEDFTHDDTLREFFDDRKWDREIYTQKGLEDGIEIGMEQGYEKGLNKGLVQGLEKVAKKMLRKSKDIREIHELTGLSIKEINRIKNTN